MRKDSPSSEDLTTIIKSWSEGHGKAFDLLVERVYERLKEIAENRLRQLDPNSTVSAGDLLHEALINIMGTDVSFNNRAHFFATMSLTMRTILVDHARARVAQKRGGGVLHLTLTGINVGEESSVTDLLALDRALDHLQTLDPRSSEVLHLTFFAGLSREEIAEVLKVSQPTVVRDLRFAKSWLNRHMGYDL